MRALTPVGPPQVSLVEAAIAICRDALLALRPDHLASRLLLAKARPALGTICSMVRGAIHSKALGASRDALSPRPRRAASPAAASPV